MFLTFARDFKKHRGIAYRNPWIVKNRWRGKVRLYQYSNKKFKALPYPNTNLIIVTRKKSKSLRRQ